MWIDTEFNEFRGELISMAIVTEDDQRFYEAVPCGSPGEWVAKNVIPVIHRTPIHITQLRQRLFFFLSQFDSMHLVADWPEDIAHFCNTLICGPGQRINTPTLTMEIRRDLDAMSAIPHNALADALAMREKHLELERAATNQRGGD
jgi:hypothetical protein